MADKKHDNHWGLRIERRIERGLRIQSSFRIRRAQDPEVPTGLTVTVVSETELQASVDAIGAGWFKGFNFYLDGVLQNSSPQASNTYNFPGLTTGQQYTIKVTSVNLDDIESAGTSANATPADVTAPAAPTGLVATVGDSLIDLDWDDNSEPDLAGYNVYVDDGNGYVKDNGALVATSDYQVTGLTNGQNYNFKVTAVDNSSNESSDSNVVTEAPEPGTVVPAPFNLVLSPGDQIIEAAVDLYPLAVDSYNWYLDDVLVTTTPDGDPTHIFTGLNNSQAYKVGVSVTVGGVESAILDWTNYIFDTNGVGDRTLPITNRPDYGYQSYFYSGANNRTYVVWMSDRGSSVDNYIFYYDHDTGAVSSAFLATQSTIAEIHLHASLVIDSAGNIYVAVEDTHNGDIRIYKSDSPEDISSFTLVNTLTGAFAYPKLWVDGSDNLVVVVRVSHNSLRVFRSTDGASSFSSNALTDPLDGSDDRWPYNGIIYAPISEGFHLFVNLHDNVSMGYPDCYHLYSPDGNVWGNAEYYESGGASGFSKDVTVNAITKAELDSNCLITSDVASTSLNYATAGSIDPGGTIRVVVAEGDFGNNPDLTAHKVYSRSGGAWVAKDISSIVSLTDFTNDGSRDSIVEFVAETSMRWKAWTRDQQYGPNAEYTEFITFDGGDSWNKNAYTSRNSEFNTRSQKAVIQGNWFDAPEALLFWSYITDPGVSSDVRTTIKPPADAIPLVLSNDISLNFDLFDYVAVGDVNDINNSGHTWMCWFKTTQSAGVLRMLDKRGQGAFGSGVPGMQLSVNTGNAANEKWKNAALEDVSGNVVGGSNFTSVPFPNDGAWHHVALVWDNDNGKLSIYIDFALEDEDTNAAMIGADCRTGRAFNLGRANTDAQYYDGILDEIQVWDRALTLSEIQDYGNRRLQGNEYGLMYYASCEDQAGTLTDLAGGNNGTIVNANYVVDAPF